MPRHVVVETLVACSVVEHVGTCYCLHALYCGQDCVICLLLPTADQSLLDCGAL